MVIKTTESLPECLIEKRSLSQVDSKSNSKDISVFSTHMLKLDCVFTCGMPVSVSARAWSWAILMY